MDKHTTCLLCVVDSAIVILVVNHFGSSKFPSQVSTGNTPHGWRLNDEGALGKGGRGGRNGYSTFSWSGRYCNRLLASSNSPSGVPPINRVITYPMKCSPRCFAW